VILTIAGSDCSGGAGIQADLKTVECNGGFGASAITAVTVQNTVGVRRVFPLPDDLVGEQIDAVLSDLEVAAVKSGMLAGRRVVHVVAESLKKRRPACYVLDPVLTSSSGTDLLEPSAIESLLGELIPLSTLITPNVNEAQRLTGLAVRDVEGAERAGRKLLELGAGAVLVKGGHLEMSPGTDVLVTPSSTRTYEVAYIDSPHTHGTGCVYSAAIATWLGRGEELEAAVERAKSFVTQAIRHGLNLGHGDGPTDPCFLLHDEVALS